MKNSSFVSLVALALLALSLTFTAGCRSDGKKESHTEDAMERTGDAIATDTKDATDQAGADAREAGDKIKSGARRTAADFKIERDKALADMRDEQVKLNAKIDNLQADIKRQGNKAKASSREELAKLEVKRKELGQDMRHAQDATADAWDEIKKGFKRAGDRLKE